MNCYRCAGPTDDSTVDFSFKILLCRRCASSIRKLRNQIRSELEVLITFLDETMLFAAVANDPVLLMEPNKDRLTLLTEFLKADHACRDEKTRSSKSTKLSAPTVTGKGNTSSV